MLHLLNSVLDKCVCCALSGDGYPSAVGDNFNRTGIENNLRHTSMPETLRSLTLKSYPKLT